MSYDKKSDSPAHNGVLRCCNQFPRHYSNFDDMTKALPEIASLGFNAVWINPVHMSGKHKKINTGRFGSLYAIADYFQFNPAFSVVPRKESGAPKKCSWDDTFEQDKAALKRYTAEARRLGMTAMFDFVPAHAAVDAPIVSGTDPHFKDVDTTRWFKRHPNGKPVVHGLDEHGNVCGEKVWDDVAKFNYDDPAIADEIFEKLWKPYIDMYIRELGFEGVRIDALTSTPSHMLKRTMDYMTEACIEAHGHPPILLGETLGTRKEGIPRLHGLGFSHVTNLAYWAPVSVGPNASSDAGSDHRSLWNNGGGWYTDNMGGQQQIVHFNEKSELFPDRKGGTIGFPSFHDNDPWARKLSRSGIKNALQMEWGMREKMAFCAFTSDAGWFMPSSDMDADMRKSDVFEGANHPPRPQCDMRGFIREINAILDKLPTTQFGTWPERLFIDEQPELMVINRHNGYGRGGTENLILVNMNPQEPLKLTEKTMRELAERTGRSVRDFRAPEEHGIFCCGGIELGREEVKVHQYHSNSAAAAISSSRADT